MQFCGGILPDLTISRIGLQLSNAFAAGNKASGSSSATSRRKRQHPACIHGPHRVLTVNDVVQKAGPFRYSGQSMETPQLLYCREYCRTDTSYNRWILRAVAPLPPNVRCGQSTKVGAGVEYTPSRITRNHTLGLLTHGGKSASVPSMDQESVVAGVIAVEEKLLLMDFRYRMVAPMEAM